VRYRQALLKAKQQGMAESGDSKSWWQRMSSQPAGLSTRDRQKSLDAKFSDPTFLTDEPGFPSAAQKPGIPGQHLPHVWFAETALKF